MTRDSGSTAVRCAFLWLLASAAAHAQTIECVNLRPDGLALNAADATSCTLSADGNLVAFATASNHLIPGAPTHSQIYVRDRVSGALTIASRSSTGEPANNTALNALISADGRYVAFSTPATNLDPNDTIAATDVYVHDRQLGTTTWASLGSNGWACKATSISADGRFVVFETGGAIVPTDTNQRSDVYVRDMVTMTTLRASVSSSGGQSTGNCSLGSISADGNRIVFLCDAGDLWPGDANGFTDVFVRDLAAGTTTLVSRSTSGAAANQASYRPTLSGDGETVAFLSAANNLDPAFTVSPAQIHVYTRDLVTGTTHLADVSISGAAADGSASFGPQDSRPRLSHDGRYLVFASAAVDIVAGDTNGDEDVFNLDRTLGTIERVSLGACSQEQDAGSVKWPGVSDDGRFVVFASSALNMIASHITLFENFDVLVRNPTAPALGALVCAGTDSAPCPCGQPAPPTRGCPNSFTASGLCASGEARLSADTLRLGVYELPFINENQITCIFFQGTQALAGGMGVPFGDGVRCIGGRLVRLIAKPTDYFQGTFYPNLGEPSISIAGAISAPGTTRYYQLWYNDFSDTFCSESRFNFSNAVEVVWLP